MKRRYIRKDGGDIINSDFRQFNLDTRDKPYNITKILSDINSIDINQTQLEDKDFICKNIKFDSYKLINNDLYEKFTIIENDEIQKTLRSFLDNECKLKKDYCCEYISGGGESIFETVTSDELIILKQYCSEFNNIIDTSKEDLVLKSINPTYRRLVTEFNQEQRDSVLFLLKNLPRITTIIQDNYNKQEISYDILFHKYHIDTGYTGKLRLQNHLHIFQKKIVYYDYNKDLILSYQKEQLELYQSNKEAIYEYILSQITYIHNLPEHYKRVLKDYTRLKSFSLYQEYCKDTTSDKSVFFTNYKQLFTEESHDDIIINKMSNAFADYILDILRSRGQHVDANVERSILDKGYYDNANEIYKTITVEEWKVILNKYLEDLTKIILEAPPVTCEFICYRGVADDYVKPNSAMSDIVVFNSSRSSSVSFNYEASKKYYDKGPDEKKRTLYKVLIKPGCKLLFVSPLAGTDIKTEMELILPPNHSFLSLGTDAWRVLKTANNINNTNNICINERDIIRSKNLQLLTPEQTATVTNFQGSISAF